MADDKRAEAIDIIARRWICERATYGIPMWIRSERDAYGLGRNEQMAISDQVAVQLRALAPTVEQYEAAVEFLASLNTENSEETARQE